MLSKFDSIIYRLIKECEYRDIFKIEEKSYSMPWHPETFIFWVKKLNGTFIVAEHENDLIGFCGIGFTKKGTIIFNIAVLPSYRNKGIGSSLLNEAISITNKKNISKIYLEVAESNTIALQLYKKRGFKPIKKMENFYVNTNEHAMEMELIVAKS